MIAASDVKADSRVSVDSPPSRLVMKGGCCYVHLISQLRERAAADVPGAHPLQVLPDTLNRTQVRRKAPQMLRPQSLCTTVTEKGVDHLARWIGDPSQITSSLSARCRSRWRRSSTTRGPRNVSVCTCINTHPSAVKVPIADRWSRVSGTLSVVGRPRGASVRTRASRR